MQYFESDGYVTVSQVGQEAAAQQLDSRDAHGGGTLMAAGRQHSGGSVGGGAFPAYFPCRPGGICRITPSPGNPVLTSASIFHFVSMTTDTVSPILQPACKLLAALSFAFSVYLCHCPQQPSLTCCLRPVKPWPGTVAAFVCKAATSSIVALALGDGLPFANFRHVPWRITD